MFVAAIFRSNEKYWTISSGETISLGNETKIQIKIFLDEESKGNVSNRKSSSFRKLATNFTNTNLESELKEDDGLELKESN